MNASTVQAPGCFTKILITPSPVPGFVAAKFLGAMIVSEVSLGVVTVTLAVIYGFSLISRVKPDWNKMISFKNPRK